MVTGLEIVAGVRTVTQILLALDTLASALGLELDKVILRQQERKAAGEELTEADVEEFRTDAEGALDALDQAARDAEGRA